MVNVTSLVEVAFRDTGTLLTTMELKPVAVTDISYAPGSRLRTRYSPALPVLAFDETPVASFLIFMFAPGMTAPVASLTTPAMLPLVT